MMTPKESKSAWMRLRDAMDAMRDPVKNSANPHFRNRYADLGEVIECVRGPLLVNNLLLVQCATRDALLRTAIYDAESGTILIESEQPLFLDKQTPQGQGSAMTYARRYALKAMFGMADVDDDGEQASQPAPERNRERPAQQTSQPAPERPDPPAQEPKQYGPKPYDMPDEAAAAITAAKTKEGVRQVGMRISASGFLEEENAQLRDLAARRMKDLT